MATQKRLYLGTPEIDNVRASIEKCGGSKKMKAMPLVDRMGIVAGLGPASKPLRQMKGNDASRKINAVIETIEEAGPELKKQEGREKYFKDVVWTMWFMSIDLLCAATALKAAGAFLTTSINWSEVAEAFLATSTNVAVLGVVAAGFMAYATKKADKVYKRIEKSLAPEADAGS